MGSGSAVISQPPHQSWRRTLFQTCVAVGRPRENIQALSTYQINYKNWTYQMVRA